MNKEEQYQQLHYRPSRMEENHTHTPKDVFDQLFSSFSLQECREHLWELYSRCVLCYKSEGTEHEDSVVILHFYTQLEALVESAFILKNKEDKKRDRLYEMTNKRRDKKAKKSKS